MAIFDTAGYHDTTSSDEGDIQSGCMANKTFQWGQEIKGESEKFPFIAGHETSVYFHKPSHRCRGISLKLHGIYFQDLSQKHHILHQDKIRRPPRRCYHSDLSSLNPFIFLQSTSWNTRGFQPHYFLTTHHNSGTQIVLSGAHHI
jgi:hypothetical protein